MAEWTRVAKLVLRSLQVLFALIAFAASAYLQTKGERAPKINFMVFTGVTAWLISILYIVVSFREGLQRVFMGIVEVVVSSLWLLFFLAAAASYTAFAECRIKDVQLREFTECNAFLTSEATAWLSVLVWAPSVALAVIDLRNGEGLTGSRY